MKKIISLALIAIMLLCFAGCAELVSEESIEVDAVITGVDRDPMRYIGKTLYPADYDIYFEYDGVRGSWDVSREIYSFYADKIGETIKCYLITRTYDDGSTKVTLKAIKDK